MRDFTCENGLFKAFVMSTYNQDHHGQPSTFNQDHHGLKEVGTSQRFPGKISARTTLEQRLTKDYRAILKSGQLLVRGRLKCHFSILGRAVLTNNLLAAMRFVLIAPRTTPRLPTPLTMQTLVKYSILFFLYTASAPIRLTLEKGRTCVCA